MGCGTVIFRSDDCQNQVRAAFRRGRRHVAATRNRIKRLGRLLVHLGAFSEERLKERMAQGAGHSFPWLLAAQVLGSRQRVLDWEQLWDVLRWYAHNRGYDGNSLWAGAQQQSEDTKKEENANRLMQEQRTSTMAETVCAFLGVDPASAQTPKLEAYFKGNDAAFPRAVVRDEVLRILKAHVGVLKGCDEDFITCLCGEGKTDWQAVRCPAIRLPGRYHGGLLFGQMVPRFDNRIIPQCRISGEKTPDKHCRDFYRYRWGMLLCNFRVRDINGEGSRRLSAVERMRLHGEMVRTGYMTKTSLIKALREVVGAEPANIDMLLLAPEMERALVLDPVQRLVTSDKIAGVWAALPEKQRKVFAGRLFKGKPSSFAIWREALVADAVATDAFDRAVEAAYAAYLKRARKNVNPVDAFVAEPIVIEMASGRAAYSGELMRKAWDAVFDDSVPDPKDRGGCLEETAEVMANQVRRSIDEQTNNALIRHRLLVFRSLLRDLIRNYAGADISRVSNITIEVVRDLQEFSAKTAQEKAQLLGRKLADHKKAVQYIEEHLPSYAGQHTIGAGLIQKVRIARDMGWMCPYTGKPYDFGDIVNGRVDREHIIPRSWRPSDSMESLVLTWPEVNRMKGQKIAWKFMADNESAHVPGTDLQLQTLSNYERTVKALKPGFDPRSNRNALFIDDDMRRWKRKQLLLLQEFDVRRKKDGSTEQDNGFTGRDLTQTSHLNKLAGLQARAELASIVEDEDIYGIPHITMIGGSVTASVRKAWKLEGCLVPVCPETEGKSKADVRSVTHLHHALDAVAIGLGAYFFPKNGRLWELMSRRSIRSKEDQAEFRRWARQPVSFSADGSWRIADLPRALTEEITERLGECRVVQHMPKTMRGLKVQQNTWRVLYQDPDDSEKMVLGMTARDADKKRQRKTAIEKKSKLLGLQPRTGEGKLSRLKGSLIVKENYGVALDPDIQVIPYMSVYAKMCQLRQENQGLPPRVLRIGSVIRVEEGRYKGVWRISGVQDGKAGYMVDILAPELVKVADKMRGCARNVLLKSLIKGKLTILNQDYSGH